jgi:nicotinamidase-related amidase
MAALRSVGRVSAQTSAFFLCDLQERFRTGISHMPAILKVAQRLVAASQIMDIPMFVTEQYPERT